LLLISVQTAFQIKEDDYDFGDNHKLKSQVKKQYEEKYSTQEYSSGNEEFVSW
jgi:hypothetical protein